MTGAVTHQTKAMIRGQQREDRYRLVIKEGLPALQNMRDFRQILEIVQVVLERTFKGNKESREGPFGRGIRGIRFKGEFQYTNNLFYNGEFKTGWRTGVGFVLDHKQSVQSVLNVLEQLGFRASVTGHHFYEDARDIEYHFDIFILSDDYATMAVKRRFAGQDEKPGPTPTSFPKDQ